MLQKPDKKGIRYALKYALKDQNGLSKSEGTNRLPKAEVWAASMFRMSKKPPIGYRYLEKICDEADAGGYVYPSMRLRVPNIDGFWYPSGILAEYFLARMHDINAKRREQLGVDLPQWSALIAEFEAVDASIDVTKQLEVLHYGKTKKGNGAARSSEERREARAALDQYIAIRRQDAESAAFREAEANQYRRYVGRCGGFKPCVDCYFGLADVEKRAVDAGYQKTAEEWFAGVAIAVKKRRGWKSSSDRDYLAYFDRR